MRRQSLSDLTRRNSPNISSAKNERRGSMSNTFDYIRSQLDEEEELEIPIPIQSSSNSFSILNQDENEVERNIGFNNNNSVFIDNGYDYNDDDDEDGDDNGDSQRMENVFGRGDFILKSTEATPRYKITNSNNNNKFQQNELRQRSPVITSPRVHEMEKLAMTSEVMEIEGVINPEQLMSDSQYELLLHFYRFLKTHIPQTHNRNSKSFYISKKKDRDKVDRHYMFGVEVTEWVLLARNQTANRREALAVCESLLVLQLIIKVRRVHTLRHFMKLPTSHQRLLFKDDKTRYFFISESIISNKQKYCEFLWKRYTNYRYVPNITRYINKLFKIQEPVPEMTPETTAIPVPEDRPVTAPHDQGGDAVVVNDASPHSPSNSSPNSESSKNSESILERMFNYSSHVPVDERQYNPSPLERKKLKTDIGTIHVETQDNDSVDVLVKSGFTPLELITSNYKSVELDVTSFKWTKYIPLVTFGISLATSALAIQWRTMHSLFSTPAWLYKLLVTISSAILVTAITIEGISIAIHPSKVINDFKNTIQVTYWCIIAMSLFQIADIAIEFSRGLAATLYWISFVIQCFATILLIVQIIVSHKKNLPLRLTPTFLFHGTGFILGGYTAEGLGYHNMSWALWGIGSIYGLILEIAILISYWLFGLLPPEHIPSQTIFIAFPSVAFSALVQVHESLNIQMRIFYSWVFINLAIVIVLWILMKRRFRVARIFHLGWWALCFPMISFGSATLNYYKYTRFLSCKIFAIMIVSISDSLYVLVASLTLYHLIRRNLFISSRYKLPV